MYTLSLEIMSLETAQKAIDIAVHEANKQHDRTLMVYFIGGEPLMAFNLIGVNFFYLLSVSEKLL